MNSRIVCDNPKHTQPIIQSLALGCLQIDSEPNCEVWYRRRFVETKERHKSAP